MSDRILTLVIDYYTGNAAPRDRRVLEEWVSGSPLNEKAFRDCLRLLEDITIAQRSLSLRNVKKIGNAPRRKTVRRRIWYGAAALAVVLAGSLLFRPADTPRYGDAGEPRNVTVTRADGSVIVLDPDAHEDRIELQDHVDMVHRGGSLVCENRQTEDIPAQAVTYPVISVPAATTFGIVLEDGTHIRLNAASRLRFPSRFTGGERRVYLEGEAYFEVAPDPAAPFIVEVDGQSLTVLGTDFNVQAYGGEPEVVTTLVEGSVRVESDGGGECVLSPGEQSRLDRESLTFAVTEVVTGDFTSWKDGLISLDNLTLVQVLAKLSRWYGVEFAVVDHSIEGIALEGAIPNDNDLRTVLGILESVSRVKFKIKSDVIEVKTR